MRLTLSKQRIFNVYIYIIFILIIMLSGSRLILVPEEKGMVSIIYVIISMPLFVSTFKYKETYLGIIIASSLLIFQLLSGNTLFLMNYILDFSIKFIITFCLTVFLLKKEIDFLKIIYNIIIFISIYSLFLYLIIYVLKLEVPYIVWLKDTPYGIWKMKSYLYYLFNEWNFIRLGSTKIYRLSSLFWEPGVYQIYLNLALIYNLLYKSHKGKLLLILINLILTFSTTGYIMGGICLAVFYIKSIVKASSKKKLFIRISIAMPILGIVTIFSYRVIMHKVNNFYDSFYVRLNDLTRPFELIASKPLFGWGYRNFEPWISISNKYHDGMTNSIIYVLYFGGIVYFLFYLASFIGVYVSLTTSRIINLTIIIWLIISCLSEPLLTSPIMSFICSLGILGLLKNRSKSLQNSY